MILEVDMEITIISCFTRIRGDDPMNGLSESVDKKVLPAYAGMILRRNKRDQDIF